MKSCVCLWHHYLPAFHLHLHVWPLLHFQPVCVRVLCKRTMGSFSRLSTFKIVYGVACALIYIYIEILYMWNVHGWRMCNYYSYFAPAFTLIVQARRFSEFLNLKLLLIWRKRSEILQFWGSYWTVASMASVLSPPLCTHHFSLILERLYIRCKIPGFVSDIDIAP